MGFFNDIEKEQLVDLYNHFENIKEGAQLRKLGEEHQELIESLILFEHGVGDIDDVISEFADNFILLFQHIYNLDITDDEIKDAMKKKLTRTLERVSSGYYEQSR